MRPPFDIMRDARDNRLATTRSPVEASKGTLMRRHAVAYYVVTLTLICAAGIVLGLAILK